MGFLFCIQEILMKGYLLLVPFFLTAVWVADKTSAAFMRWWYFHQAEYGLAAAIFAALLAGLIWALVKVYDGLQKKEIQHN